MPERRGPDRRRGSALPSDAPAEAWRMLVHVVPGLEVIAEAEVRRRFPDAGLVGAWRQFDERVSMLEFRTTSDPDAWLDLHTVEDVFVLAARAGGVRSDRAGLGDLSAALLRAKALDAALSLHRRISGVAVRNFRVVARASGDHDFRRVDAQRAAENALQTRLPRARLVEDNADAEFWLTVIRATALVGLRLSGPGMRGHTRPFVSLPATLKPTVARAMALLSDPRPDDAVLDPCCGAGSLLIERAAVAPVLTLLGGDLDAQAVAAARANVAEYDLPARIEQWDALALPIADAAADVVLTNPPFGVQIAIAGDAYRFYHRLLAEIRRVLRPNGRVVLITSQGEAMARALGERRLGLAPRRRLPILLRGQEATIYVADATAAG